MIQALLELGHIQTQGESVRGQVLYVQSFLVLQESIMHFPILALFTGTTGRFGRFESL